MNLAEETRNILRRNGKVPSDILWIGSKDFEIPVNTFWILANTEYNNNTGVTSENVAVDLVIVGEDFWLERHEYDGSEWFEYKEYPSMPDKEWEPESLKNSWEARLCSI